MTMQRDPDQPPGMSGGYPSLHQYQYDLNTGLLNGMQECTAFGSPCSVWSPVASVSSFTPAGQIASLTWDGYSETNRDPHHAPAGVQYMGDRHGHAV